MRVGAEGRKQDRKPGRQGGSGKARLGSRHIVRLSLWPSVAARLEAAPRLPL